MLSWISRPPAIISLPLTRTRIGEAVAGLLPDVAQDEPQKTHPVIQRTAERIRPLVGVGGEELSGQVPVGSVDLHRVEPSLLGPLGGVAVGLHHGVHLFGGHGMGHALTGGTGDGGRSHDGKSLGVLRLGLPPGVAQLHGDLGALRVDGVGEPSVAGDEGVVPDAALVDEALALLADGGTLGDDEPEAALGSLGVVVDQRLTGLAVGLCEVGAHGRDHHTVLDFHGADPDGCEQHPFVAVHKLDSSLYDENRQFVLTFVCRFCQ